MGRHKKIIHTNSLIKDEMDLDILICKRKLVEYAIEKLGNKEVILQNRLYAVKVLIKHKEL